jgi:hypothetical protein
MPGTPRRSPPEGFWYGAEGLWVPAVEPVLGGRQPGGGFSDAEQVVVVRGGLAEVDDGAITIVVVADLA